MPEFDAELRECVESILGVPPPLPDYDAFTFLAQWLAERNLGLVPIADAHGFDWPGRGSRASAPRRATTLSSCSAPRQGRCTTHTPLSRAAGRSWRGGCSRGSTSGCRSRSRTEATRPGAPSPHS